MLWIVLATVGKGLEAGAVYGMAFAISIAAFAAAAAVALLRHRVLEVDLLLRRAFTIVGVTAISFAVFAIVFAAVGALAGDGPAAALGAGLAVVAIAVPVRLRVRARVDRLLYGHRDVSIAVARMSREFEGELDPHETLPGLARAAAETLGASGVVLEPDARLGLAAVRVGSAPAEPALERELRHRGQSLGRVVLGARAPGEPYAPGDLALVEILSAQLALALDAVALATQLQISRGRS